MVSLHHLLPETGTLTDCHMVYSLHSHTFIQMTHSIAEYKFRMRQHLVLKMLMPYFLQFTLFFFILFRFSSAFCWRWCTSWAGIYAPLSTSIQIVSFVPFHVQSLARWLNFKIRIERFCARFYWFFYFFVGYHIVPMQSREGTVWSVRKRFTFAYIYFNWSLSDFVINYQELVFSVAINGSSV